MRVFFHCVILLHFSCLTQSAHENVGSQTQRFASCTATVRTKDECGENTETTKVSMNGERVVQGWKPWEIGTHFGMAKRVLEFL